MHIKNKRGQSTVEYILLVTAVVAVMIVFATDQKGILQTQLTNSLNMAVQDVGTKASQLSTSHEGENAVGGNLETLYTINVIPGAS